MSYNNPNYSKKNSPKLKTFEFGKGIFISGQQKSWEIFNERWATIIPTIPKRIHQN